MIEAASTGSLGEVCVNAAGFKSLPAGVALDPRRYDTARQKVDMTAMVLQNLGAAEATRRNGESYFIESRPRAPTSLVESNTPRARARINSSTRREDLARRL